MKKLMVMLGVVATAASLSAASVTWKVSGVDAKDTADTEGYITYFFMSSDTSSASTTTISQDAAAALAMAQNATALAANSMVSAKGLSDEGGVSSAKLSAYKDDWVNPAVGKFFAIVFNADTVAEATYYQVIGDATVNFGTASANSSASLSAGSLGKGWVAIPEPTSGLLMLLGMAGLALKRKRA